MAYTFPSHCIACVAVVTLFRRLSFATNRACRCAAFGSEMCPSPDTDTFCSACEHGSLAWQSARITSSKLMGLTCIISDYIFEDCTACTDALAWCAGISICLHRPHRNSFAARASTALICGVIVMHKCEHTWQQTFSEAIFAKILLPTVTAYSTSMALATKLFGSAMTTQTCGATLRFK
jgi:hypothetical protein